MSRIIRRLTAIGSFSAFALTALPAQSQTQKPREAVIKANWELANRRVNLSGTYDQNVSRNATYTAEFCAPERLVATFRNVPCNVSYLSDVFSLRGAGFSTNSIPIAATALAGSRMSAGCSNNLCTR